MVKDTIKRIIKVAKKLGKIVFSNKNEMKK